MPGWEDVLVAVGGGLEGYTDQRRHDENLNLDKEKLTQQNELARLREEVRVMVAGMTEEGRNDRYGKPSGNVVAQQTGATQRTGMQQEGATTRTGMQQTGATDRAQMVDDTRRRGQDFGQENFGKTNDRMWEGLRRGDARSQERNWLTERGQDITHDLGNRRIDEGGDSKAIGYALEAYRNELARRRTGDGLGIDDPSAVPDFKSWLDTSQDPEIFPSVRRMFSGGGGAPATPDTPAAAPVMAPTAAPRPRPQTPAAAPAAPAARPQAAAGKYSVGQSVKLRSGQTVTIKKINPDGTFEY